MRKFTATCIDNVTNMVMVLSDCSYNNACSFLECENANNKFGHFISATNRTLYLTEIKFENASFIYDEVRGVLLRSA